MWNWIRKSEELRKQGQPFALLTVTHVTGSTPRETGAKMIALSDGKFFGTVGGGHLEQLVLADTKKVFDSGHAQVLRYPLGAKTGQCCGGIVEILFEPIHCGPRLYLFGAGHVAQAVCRSLVDTPFLVHLIDERPEWLESPEVSADVIRHLENGTDFIETASWDPSKSYAVVMTHRHDLDQEIIHQLIQKPAKYVGLIGSQSKWERFKQRLSAQGVDATLLARVQSPIGIPIGGKAPQEVAISLAAQLIQIHYAGSPHV